MTQSARSRWLILAAFTAVAGISQMLWLNFAPILLQIQARYGVGELWASTLVLVFPLIYVLLSLPAGALIDRVGYRRVVLGGALLQAAAAALRYFDESFVLLFVAQVLIAVAQPFVVNGVNKLVADWFEEEHAALATGIVTIGMFLGMALAMALTPLLYEGVGLSATMLVFFAVAVLGALAFLLFGVERRVDRGVATLTPWAALWHRDLLLLLGVAFFGMGFFNGLTTWFEPLLARNGVAAVEAGAAAGVLIIAGIVGAGIVPALSDKLRRRKPFIVGCAAAALVALYPLGESGGGVTLHLWSGLVGFFFLPAFALLLEMCAELSGQALAGFATGVLMLMGNAGAVLLIVVMPLVKGDGELWSRTPLDVLSLSLIGAIGLALPIRETFRDKSKSAAPAHPVPPSA